MILFQHIFNRRDIRTYAARKATVKRMGEQLITTRRGTTITLRRSYHDILRVSLVRRWPFVLVEIIRGARA